MSADECRELVEQCFRWADQSTHPATRKAFRDMAEDWIQVAFRIERRLGSLLASPAEPL